MPRTMAPATCMLRVRQSPAASRNSLETTCSHVASTSDFDVRALSPLGVASHHLQTSPARRRERTVARALIPVPSLDPRKLTVTYTSMGASAVTTLSSAAGGMPRRYTLTHNDLTAQLYLSIGEDFDERAVAGWYTQLVRDDVRAEWSFAGGPALHVHCHVQGPALFFFAPERYRDLVFRREMPLVLDSIVYAERDVLAASPLLSAPIFIHFDAAQSELARVEFWGTVGAWIHRPQSSTQAHLRSVSRTLTGAAPVHCGARELEGPLEHFLERLTEALLDDPKPGSALEEVRAVAVPAPADAEATPSERGSGAPGPGACKPLGHAQGRGGVLCAGVPSTGSSIRMVAGRAAANVSPLPGLEPQPTSAGHTCSDVGAADEASVACSMSVPPLYDSPHSAVALRMQRRGRTAHSARIGGAACLGRRSGVADRGAVSVFLPVLGTCGPAIATWLPSIDR